MNKTRLDTDVTELDAASITAVSGGTGCKSGRCAAGLGYRYQPSNDTAGPGCTLAIGPVSARRGRVVPGFGATVGTTPINAGEQGPGLGDGGIIL